MDKKTFKIGYIVGVILAIGIAMYGYYKIKSIADGSGIKSIELSEIAIENLSGKKTTLHSGKPTVINFWATWCAPCVEEFSEFDKMNKKYSDKVDFVMISDENTDKIVKFKNKKNYNLNFVRTTKSFEKYGLNLRPVSFFYNSKGKLVSKVSGGISQENLEKEIQKIIEN